MIRFLLPLALTLLPLAAEALEPKKPSQLVTLVPSAECENGDGFVYGTRVNPDGSTAPFTIPARQLLVVTRWAFSFGGGGATAGAGALLRIEGSVLPLASFHFDFNADGSGGGVEDLAAVVGEGKVLCGAHNSGLQTTLPSSGFIEGFLTKAK